MKVGRHWRVLGVVAAVLVGVLSVVVAPGAARASVTPVPGPDPSISVPPYPSSGEGFGDNTHWVSTGSWECRIYGEQAAGGYAASNPIGWDVGRWTGYHPPAPATTYQRGSNTVGGPACQFGATFGGKGHDAVAAGYLDIHWFDHGQCGDTGGTNVGFQLFANYHPTKATPGAWDKGPFRMQLRWDLASQELNSTVQYSQNCASFTDVRGYGQTIRWCPSTYSTTPGIVRGHASGDGTAYEIQSKLWVWLSRGFPALPGFALRAVPAARRSFQS